MVSEVALVLSGGGVRGIAHLGLIKALEERQIKITALSGTSAGAIIAALYAYGYNTNEILDKLLSIKTSKFIRPALSLKGLLKLSTLYNLLQQYFPENEFSALNIPVSICATNLRTGRSEYFKEGDLIGAICASSCIPVLFDPFQYNDELYIDGGILNNLPVQPLLGSHKTIIGSHCNPTDENFEPKNARLLMERALNLAITKNSYGNKHLCDFFFEPVGLEPFKVMDLGHAREIYQIGYKQALTQLDKSDLFN